MPIVKGERGERVRDLQLLLKRNKYGSFYTGTLDGIFGKLTAEAVHEAKWFCGYRKGRCSIKAGEQIQAILRGRRRLTTAQNIRRKVRLKRAAATPVRMKALEAARGDVGITEQGENRIKYSSWWGWGPAAYCVMAVSYWYSIAGSGAPVKGSRWANTDALLWDAKCGRNGVRLVASPAPGDAFVIDFDGHTDPDHAGLIEAVNVSTFSTIEGNTTKPGTSIEGVWRRERPRANCWTIRVTK